MNNFIPVMPEPQQPVYQAPSRAPMKMWPIVLTLAVVVVAALGFFFKDQLSFLGANISDTLPTQGHQAVFLTSGQVYFGKLERAGEWFKLSDVYYLQVDQNLQQGSTPLSSNFQLVKLGSEIHGPEDTMYVEPQNVLFWENLKTDSQVLQAIGRYKQN
jgi:hypothetical protein